jgi:hypothetical protein
MGHCAEAAGLLVQAECHREEALSKFSRLYELLETDDYERLDPKEEYESEDDVEEELAALRSWARKQELCFVWNGEAWQLEQASEDTKATQRR